MAKGIRSGFTLKSEAYNGHVLRGFHYVLPGYAPLSGLTTEKAAKKAAEKASAK
jgi:hypothetical protein